MLFNSTEFLRFFLVFAACYFVVRKSILWRNILVTLGSYLFYAGWDYRYTLLLFGTTLIDFIAGLAMQRATSSPKRKAILLFSLCSNLGVLAVFKYAGFAVESVENVSSLFGLSLGLPPINITLPVGISFYTFQSLSYTIDVYRRSISAETSFLRFAGYVAFFPQLVAGPIERADRLLPQFSRSLTISGDDLREGASLVIQGLFKKVVLADSLGRLVELSCDTPGIPAPILLLGTAAFGFQIYCDFSGYSDIARGIARWLGFSLCSNFERPYLSCSIPDFWRRWHTSLSSWLRDYLYIPLGGNRHGTGRMIFALLITMLLGGLWHGARLNFLLWGLWHGLALAIAHLWHRSPLFGGKLPRPVSWTITMAVVFYGWMLFRASSVDDLWNWHAVLFSDWSWPVWGNNYLLQVTVLVLPLLMIEFAASRLPERYQKSVPTMLARVVAESLLLMGVIVCWRDDPPEFIYFQF